MKRLLVLGTSAALMSIVSMTTLAGPSVYGKANISLQSEDGYEDDSDSWKLRSNASRLGVKGSEPITDGLSAIYKLEYEVYFDDGDDGSSSNSEFKQRNIYAGLQSQYGTLIAGKFDTPLKVAQGKFDQFNDLNLGDIKYSLMGDNRPSNIIMYSTPKMFGGLLKANVAIIPGEENERDDGQGARDEVADSVSASIELGDAGYKKHGWFASVAYDDEVRSEWRGNGSLDGKYYMDTLRGTAGVKLGNLKLAAIAQTAEQTDADAGRDEIEHEGYGVSASYGIGKVVLKAQYLQSEIDVDDNAGNTVNDEEIDQWSIGADYKLNKRTKAYAYYSKIESDVSEDEDGAKANQDDDTDTFGVGMEVKFGK